jgi:hypothetical protein
MPGTSRVELFHRIAETDSAEARRRIAELGVTEVVEFRNVDFESHRAALAARGGEQTPALWDGTQLHVGRELVLTALEELARAR